MTELKGLVGLHFYQLHNLYSNSEQFLWKLKNSLELWNVPDWSSIVNSCNLNSLNSNSWSRLKISSAKPFFEFTDQKNCNFFSIIKKWISFPLLSNSSWNLVVAKRFNFCSIKFLNHNIFKGFFKRHLQKLFSISIF